MKKGTKAALIAAEIISVLVIVLFWIWGGELHTISGIRQVGDDPYLYTCDYYAKYDLDEVIEQGIDENSKLVAYVIGKISRGLYKPDPAAFEKKKDTAQSFACTSFQAKNADSETGWIFGRNYDFFKNPTLVVTSIPRKGYRSISICDLSHLGYSLDKLPKTFASKALCLASIYAPMDGINKKGLCVSIMALPKQAAWQDSGKSVVGTSIIMRLILDRCATVDEAIALVQSLDIRHDQKAGSGYHYLVADKDGNCAGIEFDPQDGWKTMIVEKDEASRYMHMTNHLLSPKYYTTEPDETVGNPHSKSWWRYETVDAFLSEREGTLSPAEAQQCLSDVHWKDLVWDNGMVENTQWSAVYQQEPRNQKLLLRHWYNYDFTWTFEL